MDTHHDETWISMSTKGCEENETELTPRVSLELVGPIDKADT